MVMARSTSREGCEMRVVVQRRRADSKKGSWKEVDWRCNGWQRSKQRDFAIVYRTIRKLRLALLLMRARSAVNE